MLDEAITPQPSASAAPVQPETTAAPAAPVDERTGVLVAHLSGLASFFGPLIVLLVYRGKSVVVEREAKEALNFQLTVAIATAVLIVAGIVLAFVLVGFFLLMLAWLLPIAGVVFAIVGAVKSNQTGAFRYPATWRMVK
ncbi:DUF4870 domain-containing protein [Microbacterium sp. CPCC 204701]|uniref:DUF4870 domain-containing protein n=1 Tax=Microbacterium sp. CPCC 204701 TaxID=2493084 RepID=UPI000FDB2830|nr:DUF4870 domain-containing protein [Microbacterium sp. CPCC 204701]